MAGAVPVPVPTDAAHDWQPTAEQVAPLIRPRTRAIIVDSPHNPTGAVYTRETLAGLVGLAMRHESFTLLSDEIYESMVYDGGTHISVPGTWPEAHDRIVLLNSMSKTYAMTGWRIGYAAAPKAVASAITDIQAHLGRQSQLDRPEGRAVRPDGARGSLGDGPGVRRAAEIYRRAAQ